MLTDGDIARLLAEPKVLTFDPHQTPRKTVGASTAGEFSVTGTAGSEFVIKLRQSKVNVFDFSIILCYIEPGTNHAFRLRRYNGKSHSHSNTLERTAQFYDFHIHMATERYQRAGIKEDSYAEVSNRYSDSHTALDCMIQDCGFELPRSGQLSLLTPGGSP